MIKNSLYISIMFMYINLLGYILHIFIARKLGPIDYGEFMVVYSLMLSIGFLSSVFPSITIKTVVDRDKVRYDVFRFLRIVSIITGIFVMLTAIIISKHISLFLKIEQKFVILVGFVWLFVFISAVEKGFLQANEKFGLYSVVNSVELTLRFIIAIVLLYIGYGVVGVIASNLIAIVIITLILYIINGNLIGQISKINLKESVSLVLTSFPSGFFIYADDIFIRRIFDPSTAGFYASASIVGKAFIWLCITIFSIFFVKMMKDIEKYKYILTTYIGFVMILTIFAEFIIVLFGKNILTTLFGENFKISAEFLVLYLPATLPMIVSVAIFSTNIGLRTLTKLIYIHLIVYIGGFFVVTFHTPHMYLLYIFCINAVFVVVYIYLLFLVKKL